MAVLFKTIVAAATLIAASAAHADWQFQSGTGTLTFSDDAYWTLDRTNTFLDTWYFTFIHGVNNRAQYDDLYPNPSRLTLDFTSSTTAGNHLQSLTSTGSALGIERYISIKGRTVLDRWIELSDFSFDLNTKTLSAQATSVNLLDGVVTNHGLQPIFSATALIGDNTISGGKISFSTAGPLTLHTAFADTLLNALDTSTQYPLRPEPAILNSMWKNTDWGTFSGQATLSAVPEPSVYLSILAGLAVLGAVRARRRAI